MALIDSARLVYSGHSSPYSNSLPFRRRSVERVKEEPYAKPVDVRAPTVDYPLGFAMNPSDSSLDGSADL